MDIKIGAGGNLHIARNQAGDVLLVLKDDESLSTQSVSIALHPQVFEDALVKMLGGSQLSQVIVKDSIEGLVSFLPQDPT